MVPYERSGPHEAVESLGRAERLRALRQAESGTPIGDLCPQYGIDEQTFLNTVLLPSAVTKTSSDSSLGNLTVSGEAKVNGEPYLYSGFWSRFGMVIGRKL